jgi:hypothetical protein
MATGNPAMNEAVYQRAGRADTAAKERQLFMNWTRDLVRAVVDLAACSPENGGKKAAPIHASFFDRTPGHAAPFKDLPMTCQSLRSVAAYLKGQVAWDGSGEYNVLNSLDEVVLRS